MTSYKRVPCPLLSPTPQRTFPMPIAKPLTLALAAGAIALYQRAQK
ncbi:MAG: hypothetical protein ACK46X_07560 [Candidatus Sericytochromatia bacterium]